MTKEEILIASEEYIKSGISLIPVGKNKLPLIPWKEYQSRYATIEEISEWADKFPEMQLGAVTGKISNIIVVDVEKGGDIDWLPKTAISKTGGEGYHYFYSYVPGMTNKVRIRNLTDIRSDGGYVIVAPSETTKGKYEWLVKVPPIPFPKNLFQEPELSPQNISTFKLEYPGYGEGQRNNEMAKYIGYILVKIHPSEWNTIAWQIIEQANKKNTPPLSDFELKQTFNSIVEREKRNNADRWYKREEQKTESEMWKEEDNKILLISDIAKMDEYKDGDKYKCGIPLFDDAMGGGFEDGDLVIVSGLSGQGKTTLSQQVAVNMAEQGLPVLFLSYEVKVSHLWKKFKEMGVTDELVIYSVESNTTGNIGWIEQKIKEAKQQHMIKTVVIDHLGFLMPKTSINDISKNYSVYIGQICRELKRLALQENVIIVMPVHVRKTDDPTLNDLGNSSAIGQGSDVVIMLYRERNTNTMSSSYYKEHTKIMMVKNRKTGNNAQGYFRMINGRFEEDLFYCIEPIDTPKRWTKQPV